ncbi:MAG: hypothetical protein U9N04_01995 [Patescibacteria group bacterium]|nr:hypothetical protein [Patescibacteria group bacterium]
MASNIFEKQYAYSRQEIKQEATNEESLLDDLYEKIKDPDFIPSVKELREIFPNSRQDRASEELSRFCKKDENDPIYEFVTEELLEGLSDRIIKAVENFDKKEEDPVIVLEVGGGDGKLGYNLQKYCDKKLPDKIKVIVIDKSPRNQNHLDIVEKIDSENAIGKYNPDIVIMSWMPFEVDLTEDWRNCKNVKEYILVGETDDGCCGHETLTWGTKPYYPYDWDEENPGKEFIAPHKKDGFEREDLSDIPTFSRTMESKVVSFKRNK